MLVSFSIVSTVQALDYEVTIDSPGVLVDDKALQSNHGKEKTTIPSDEVLRDGMCTLENNSQCIHDQTSTEKTKSSWKERFSSFSMVVRVVYIFMRFSSAFGKYKKIRDFKKRINTLNGISFESMDDITQFIKACLSLMIEMETNGWIERKKGKIIIKQKRLACELFEIIDYVLCDVKELGKFSKQGFVDNGIEEDVYEEFMKSICILYEMSYMLFGEFAQERLPTANFQVRIVNKDDEIENMNEIMASLEKYKEQVKQCMDSLLEKDSMEEVDNSLIDERLSEIDNELSEKTDKEKEKSSPTSDNEDSENDQVDAVVEEKE